MAAVVVSGGGERTAGPGRRGASTPLLLEPTGMADRDRGRKAGGDRGSGIQDLNFESIRICNGVKLYGVIRKL